jgi:hypothetical protein
MRWAAAVLGASLAAAAQEPAPRADLVFTFTAEQGWALTVEGERDLFAVTERELTQGLQPNIRLGNTPPPPPVPQPRTNPPPPRPKEPPPLPGSRPAAGSMTYKRIQGDPFKVDGTLTLRADGTVSLAFQKISYADSGQRWWIEWEKEKLRTSELGGPGKWSGTRAEASSRLESIEKGLTEMYLRAVSPQKPEEARPSVGLAPSAHEPGRRLYVQMCLEEQLGLLLLARLEGAPLGKTLWPAEVAKFPPRAIGVARSVVDRLVLQAAGEIAPLKVRTARGRSVKDQPWDGQGPAVVAPGWMDGTAWAAEQRKPFQEAHRRLADLAAATSATGIDASAWGSAVQRELDRLEEGARLALPARLPGVQDPLLVPRILAPARATYDFKEDLDVKEGKAVSSHAESLGLLRDLDLAYFVSGPNRWRAGKVRLETLYKGQVKARP